MGGTICIDKILIPTPPHLVGAGYIDVRTTKKSCLTSVWMFKQLIHGGSNPQEGYSILSASAGIMGVDTSELS